MYLSRRNGAHHIWYKDEHGKKQKVHTLPEKGRRLQGIEIVSGIHPSFLQ